MLAISKLVRAELHNTNTSSVCHAFNSHGSDTTSSSRKIVHQEIVDDKMTSRQKVEDQTVIIIISSIRIHGTILYCQRKLE